MAPVNCSLTDFSAFFPKLQGIFIQSLHHIAVSPEKGVLSFAKRKIFPPSIVGQNAPIGRDSYGD
jgi:hypothetical protein